MSRVAPEVDFNRDGRQHGFLRLYHSTHASAYGFIPIPVVVLRNGAGPTALFSAATHGDEYEGQIALCNLARNLDPARIRGRVIILPAHNLPAALAGRRVSPIDDGNLNRAFPGDPDGTVTQQIAYFTEHTLIPMADIVCDLHSGGSSLHYRPCVAMRRVADAGLLAKQVAMLRAFAAPLAYVVEGGGGSGSFDTMVAAAERKGVPALSSELGGSGTLTRAGLEIAERGLNNLLVHGGILPAEARIEGPPTRILDVGGADYYVHAPEAGVFEPLAEPGDTVEAGQLAGRLHTPETPWAPPVEVHFGRGGFVLVKRIPARTARGDCLFHVGTDSAL